MIKGKYRCTRVPKGGNGHGKGRQYLSGEAISRSLGVTRAAVWKGMDRLRSEGWQVDSATNRGYRLAGAPDLLTAPLVEAFLPGPREAPVLCYGELDSTNLQGQRLALEGAKSGTVVLADRQTSGAGRMGRDFYSPGGVGIYLSYLLAPRCGGERLSLLTSCAGLAVCGAIRRTTGLEPAIKWPNDIILEGKKACGILTKLLSDGRTAASPGRSSASGSTWPSSPSRLSWRIKPSP